jgi:hypothetical protein
MSSQPAGHGGEGDLAGLLVLELVETALAAAVAERLPLLRGELAERQHPEAMAQASRHSGTLA